MKTEKEILSVDDKRERVCVKMRDRKKKKKIGRERM